MATLRGGSFFARVFALCLLAFASGVGCRLFDNTPARAAGPLLPGQSADVYSTAHPTMADAVNDFFGRRPDPVQPIEFPHNIHVGKQIACTEYCHESVTIGPVAGLPSVRTCMICHNSIARDRPRIKLITEMQTKGVDLAWQRVFGYAAQAHVKFNHAPHIRANVECATCHGNIAGQTVAQRNVDLDMGFCVNCHNEKKAPVECVTCHY